MEKVHSIEQLQQQSAEIRALRRGFLTNFFLDPVKHGMWIEKGDCYVERMDYTLFIVKKSPTFWNVFYCSTTLDDFGHDLSRFLAEYTGTTLMFDIVGRDVQCLPVVELSQSKGCQMATSLVRMTRMAEPFDYTPDATIRRATETDIPQVSQLLHEFFNPQNEQIPYDSRARACLRRARPHGGFPDLRAEFHHALSALLVYASRFSRQESGV